MIGQTLSHFKIIAKLGEGGMGKVYRAEDTKLGREVAIKLLPEAFTSDPQRFARFQREAKVLASLNHPNIAAIYELAEEAGTHFLVLELVQGEDLAERLARGPIPIGQALPLALQIAEGVEAAHHKGIVHRDLKPANVMVGPDGEVKVLDFGLAKAWEVESEDSSNLSLSPTLTAQMTQAGTLIGTAAYMSPEQARGETTDSRADVWAFGVVLMEMLTGKSVYAGKTISDCLAGVLAREPEWEDLPNGTPPSIRRLLERCLEKERSQRLQAIGEARITIHRYLAAPEGTDEATAVEATSALPTWKRLLPWAVAVALAIALGAALLKPSADPASSTRATILPPEGTSFDVGWGSLGILAVSPDGRSLAFSATDAEGNRALYIRDLEDAGARALAGTGGAVHPFWSPDGRYVAFFAEGKLMKVERSSGSPVTLATAGNGKGGTWNRSGDIVFAPSHDSGLYRISAAGGEAVQVTKVDRKRFHGHRYPQFLPDGEHFLYIARTGLTLLEPSQLMVGSLGGDVPVELFSTFSGVLYASGHLFFRIENTLMACPFDPSSLEITGEVFPVAETVIDPGGYPEPTFSISEGGTLAFLAGKSDDISALMWVDGSGTTRQAFGPRDNYKEVRLSPDGQRAAVTVVDQESKTRDLWLLDLGRGLRSRFTFNEGDDLLSVWSSDGERIAFSSRRGSGGVQQIYVKSVLTGEGASALVEDEENKFLVDWSPDERYLTYAIQSPETSWDMYAVDLIEGGEPIPLQPSPFWEGHPMVSPDGRWLAYFTDESGRKEIYVTAFPTGGRRWQVSPDGGAWPLWDPSGQSLYWIQLPGQALMKAEVDGSGEVVRIGEVSTIAEGLPTLVEGTYQYDIAPDGERFLFNITERASVPALSVVLDFPAELRRENR